MAEPFLSELRIFSFNFPPKGWAFCNGQLLAINQNQALFALLGTTYGGDGRVNFGLPNQQGSVPISTGNGFTLGQRGGEQNHTLVTSEIPVHAHSFNATNAAVNTPDPAGNLLGGSYQIYDTASNNLVKGIYAYVFADRGTGRQSAGLLWGLAACGVCPLLWGWTS